MLLEVNNIRKVYTTRLSTQSTEALKNVNFSVVVKRLYLIY